MGRYNFSTNFFYAPIANDEAGSAAVFPNNQSARNPFVKVGDRVKLRSRKGRYKVLQVDDTYLLVASISSKWLKRPVKNYKCTWAEFRCWSRR